MKVLFLSLLRIGDFFMHLQLADAYRKKYPEAEIHFLVNDLISDEIKSLFPYYKYYSFNRFELQKSINTFEAPLLYPVWELKSVVEELNAENYDLVVDLSYQKQATSFLNLIEAKDKIGVLDWEKGKFSSFEVEKFLNTFSDRKSNTHYLDELKKILHLDLRPEKALNRSSSKIISFQITTSDSKKNYDLSRWKKVIQSIKQALPEYQVQIFCTPKEYEVFKRHFAKEDLLQSGFRKIYEVLKESKLLVSLDTSTKHLAALTQTAVLELSIGSSHPFKTSSYGVENYILSAHQTCRPCEHSSKCPYLRNLCQDSIQEKRISDFVINWCRSEKNMTYDAKTVHQNDLLGFEKGKLWITNKSKEIFI